MKIEAGRFYKTREGRKVGPMCRGDGGPWHWFTREPIDGWFEGGADTGFGPSPKDIVAEWVDEPTSPVRTVTRKEIVPGIFGIVNVYPGSRKAIIRVSRPLVDTYDDAIDATSAELRAAAKVFTDLADALDEQGGAS